MTSHAPPKSHLWPLHWKNARSQREPMTPVEIRNFHRRILERNGGAWFSFETHIAALYQFVLHPAAVALDGGANVGQHTLPMIRAISPGGLVMAAEPVPELRSQIEGALQKYNVSPDSIQIVPAGLWDETCETDFFQVTNQAQHELSGLRNRHWLEPYPVRKIRVQLTTIDTICARLQRLDFIKLDVEGAEMHALRGGRKTVENFRPVISFEQDQFSPQYFGYTWEDLLNYFQALEYSVYDLFGIRYTDPEMFAGCAVWDFVALPARMPDHGAVFKALRKSMLGAGVRL